MPDWLTYDLVKDFQTAIVGIVGFVGVVWTLRSNAKLAEREREVAEQRKIRLVRNLILADLEFFKTALGRNKISAKKRPGTSVLIPRMSRVATRNIFVELGVLDPTEARLVMNILVTIDELDRSLTLFAGAGGISTEYFEIPTEKMEGPKKMRENLVAQIEQTLLSLQKMAPEAYRANA